MERALAAAPGAACVAPGTAGSAAAAEAGQLGALGSHRFERLMRLEAREPCPHAVLSIGGRGLFCICLAQAQQIADSGKGEQEARMIGVWLNLLAQMMNVRLNELGFHTFVAPDMLY